MVGDTSEEQRVAAAWSEAAQDLGIRVVAPFQVDLDGDELQCTALVPDFDDVNGTLVMTGSTEEWQAKRAVLDKASDAGYGCSFLSSAYAHYERELFVDTLNDWGWSRGPDSAPEWYSGQPWTA